MDDPIRILIVEDLSLDAELAEREIRQTLTSCIFQRVETRDDYLAALEEFQPDLIISDYQMLHLDGLTALQLARERSPLTPLIILTEAINEDTAVACMKAGAVDYVIKEHIKRLGQAVNQALEQKQLRLERRRVEETLRQSEAKYRRLYETMMDAFASVDMTGRIQEANRAFQALLGYSEEELRQLSYQDLTPAKWHAFEARLVEEQVLVQGYSEVYEKEYRRKDGTVFPVELRTFLWRDHVGRPVGMGAIVRDITERWQAELELQERNRFIDAILENAPIGFAVNTIHDGQVVFASNKFGEIYGVPPGSVNSVDEFFETVYPDPIFREQIRERVMTDIASGDPSRMHWENVPITTITGEHKVVTASNIPLWEQNLMVSTVQDVTERKQAEEALRWSEEQLRLITDNMVDVISQTDAQINVIYASPSLERIFGYPPREILGKPAVDWIHPDDVKQVLKMVAEARQQHSPSVLLQYRWRHANGDYLWVESATRLLYDEQGQSRGAIFGTRDITDRKRAEEAIRSSEDKFAKAFRTSPDSININRMSDGVYLEVNDGFTAMTGYTAADVAGKSSLEINIWADANDRAQLVQALKEQGEAVGLEARFRMKDGSIRTGLMSARLIEVNGETCILSITRDITKRKQAEEKIRRLNEELEQRVIERTAQLEAANMELEAFSYSVSHDLRAPLRAIDGYTRILEEDYEPLLDAEGQRVCAVIRRQTQRMGQLIDDLLAFSRLSRAEMRASLIDMEALANAVFHEVTTPGDRERIDFQVESLPPVVGDPTLIRQVWANLLANAVKFSAKRERAVIEVGSGQEVAENIYFVRDNGAGYDIQYADKLFGVFQRLHSDREFEGTGVGLAIVQRVIHRHGGRVWAEAEVDKGATFTFTLPWQEENFR